MFDDLTKNLSWQDIGLRFFDLVNGRVFKRAYLSLDEKGKEKMKSVFLADNDKEKENFVKKYIPSFKDFFEEEAKKIEEEVKSEVQKQF